MRLFQLLLPLYDNQGESLPLELFQSVGRELVRVFGGLTAYTRAPAEGLWQGHANSQPQRDEIVIFEIMAEQIDRAWWKNYRRKLEDRFQQRQIVIRVQDIELL